MKKKFIPALIALLLLAAGMEAQAQVKDREQQRKERISQKKAQRAANFEAISKLLDEREFVIEAYEFTNRYGQNVQVSTTTNFIAVSDSAATVQIAFPGASGGGYNGLGGITLEGRVVKFDISRKHPEKGVSFQMRVFGNALATADMFVNVDNDGFATVRYSGQYGTRFSLRGHFRSWGDASVFKGTTLY